MVNAIAAHFPFAGEEEIFYCFIHWAPTCNYFMELGLLFAYGKSMAQHTLPYCYTKNNMPKGLDIGRGIYYEHLTEFDWNYWVICSAHTLRLQVRIMFFACIRIFCAPISGMNISVPRVTPRRRTVCPLRQSAPSPARPRTRPAALP